jgi:hypothetical protein
MTVLKARDVKTGLDKLDAKEEPRRHMTYTVYDDDGTFLGETYISHGVRDIDDNLLSLMARQLKITSSLWKNIIGCSKGRLDYISMAKR